MPEITLDHIIAIATVAAVGYVIGSIPFGLILTKLAGLGDIRKIGSGNIGATNVLRTGRKGLAALTMLLDAVKGAVAMGVGYLIAPWLVPVAAFSALLGHMFPVWLKFKGGKGVSTALGILYALSWPVGLATNAIWVLTAVITRYSSVAALAGALLAPVFAWYFASTSDAVLVLVMAIMVWWRHKPNIERLLAGTESKLAFRSRTKESA